MSGFSFDATPSVGSENITPQNPNDQIFDAVFNNLYTAVAYLDRDLRFIRVNRSYASADLKSPDYFVGKKHFDLYPNVENEKIFRETLQNGQPYFATAKPFEYKSNPERGVSHWDWTLFPVKDENNFVTGLVLNIINVSDRVNALEVLHEREEQYRAAFEQTAVGMCQLTLDGSFVRVNQKLCDIFGYEERELLTLNFFELAHPDDHILDLNHVDQLLQGHARAYSLEKRFVRKDNNYVWVNVSVTLVRNTERQPVYFVAAILDIHQRKVAEEKLALYQEHLEDLVKARTAELEKTQKELLKKERLATLGQLTATVSHELRNPLASIRPSLYVLRKKIGNDEKLVEAVARIERNIVRCDNIVDELLDYTRIRDLALEPVDVECWLDEIFSDLVIPDAINVQRVRGSVTHSINVDKNRGRRAFINIFENARDALIEAKEKNGGEFNATITVSTELIDENRVAIAIDDNGLGMDDDVAQKIFEPLFSTKAFGIGLGLPTVMHIMEQHGGGLIVNTKPGVGTRMMLWFPIVAN